jgi:glyoxylase-like metal-dependent hydrolase (beta-lactamase superfamily II)
MIGARIAVSLAALAAASAVAQVQIGVDNPLRTGENQQAAVRVNDAIFLAYGFGNTFLVTTSAGNVIIDTSTVVRAARAKELLQRENAGPVKYIVLTHAHGDHAGGVPLWKPPTRK